MFSSCFALQDLEREAEAEAEKRDSTLIQVPIPARLCGVFILCERKGYPGPEAKLFTSTVGTVYPRTSGACSTRLVRGTSDSTQYNHARLWPILGEEFHEMCFYYERQHACTSGRVDVIGAGNRVLYSCQQAFDAHTVQFCMSKSYHRYCRIHVLAKDTSVTFSQN